MSNCTKRKSDAVDSHMNVPWRKSLGPFKLLLSAIVKRRDVA